MRADGGLCHYHSFYRGFSVFFATSFSMSLDKIFEAHCKQDEEEECDFCFLLMFVEQVVFLSASDV